MALQAFHANPSIGGFGNENSSSTAAVSSWLLGGNARGDRSKKTATSSSSQQQSEESSSTKDATSTKHHDRTPTPRRPTSTKVRAGTSTTTSTTDEQQSGGDALCQIVKELVDNAVDACETARKTKEEGSDGDDDDDDDDHQRKVYRVKVEILPYQPNGGDTADGAAGDGDDDTTPLQVTVSDNGCGMKDIQSCVNAFQTSKGGHNNTNTNTNSSTTTANNNTTAGRYGIGLTLCLLHAQRLVPGTYSCITSATQESPTFQRCLFFVNTAGDTVECHREEEVPKGHPTESGTCVSLLVPGGRTARAAWKRLESYLRRFHLSSVQCSIETLAPTLSKVPLHVVRTPTTLPPSAGRGDVPALPSHDTTTTTTTTTPKELLVLDEALDDIEDDIEDDNDDNGDSSSNDDEDPEPRSKRRIIREESFLEERKRVQMMAQKYGWFQNPLQLENVAHSEHPIRMAASSGAGGASPAGQRSGPNCGPPRTPKLIVDILVSPHEEEEEEGETNGSRNNHDAGSSSAASVELVRMVNSVPLLDGAESFVCGLVKGLQSSVVWASFGLSFLGGNESNRSRIEQQNSWNSSSFAIRDSDQVAPFFQSHQHQLWEDEQREEPPNHEQPDADNNAKDKVDGRKRGRNGMGRMMMMMMPAKVRLGKILVLVDIVAVPSMLPLPTLSKGRLPLNHLPITEAFHLGLRDCLKSLQLTSPGLLLTAVQLRTVERDVRYIPLLANAAAGILLRMQDPTKQHQLLRKVKHMQNDEDHGGSLNHGTMGASTKDPAESSFLRSDEIIRTIEQRTATAIRIMESAKNQSRNKRTKKMKSTKQEDDNNHEYSDLDKSDDEEGPNSSSSSSVVVSREESSSPQHCRVHTVPKESPSSLDDKSSCHSVSPSIESSSQNNDKLDTSLIPGGVPLECDDDDDDWW